MASKKLSKWAKFILITWDRREKNNSFSSTEEATH